MDVSDNKWHEVSIGRPSRYMHTLMVDGHITKQNTQGDNYHLDLDGILFLGKFYFNGMFYWVISANRYNTFKSNTKVKYNNNSSNKFFI